MLCYEQLRVYTTRGCIQVEIINKYIGNTYYCLVAVDSSRLTTRIYTFIDSGLVFCNMLWMGVLDSSEKHSNAIGCYMCICLCSFDDSCDL